MSRDAPIPDALTEARIAAEEGIDRRTLRRRLRGEPVRGLAGARADRAVAKLRALGLAAVTPEPPPAP